MSKLTYSMAGVALTVAMSCGLLSLADAQVLIHKDMSLAMAATIAKTAIETCKAEGYNVSAQVLDRDGQMIVAIRNPAAGFGTFENAMKKAWTANTTKSPSANFADRVKGDPNALQFFLANYIAAPGGLPIKSGKETLGAIGVSGAPGGDKDEACAKAGIDRVAADLK